MKRSLLVICAICITAVAFASVTIIKKTAYQEAVAQELKEVCFKVVDEYGEPIIGATISVKGTNRHASTDLDGNVCIKVRKGEVLVISYIGYPSIEIEYNGMAIGVIALLPL